MFTLEKNLILSSCAVLKKYISLQTGADSPELALPTLCDVWMRAGSTAVLHSTAPQPCHVLSVRLGNWRTTFFRNLLGSDSEEHDCSVVLWYMWQYDHAAVCKASCHLGCNIKKNKKNKGTLHPATASRCAGTGVPKAVIYNEAAIYSPVLLTVFCQPAQREVFVTFSLGP